MILIQPKKTVLPDGSYTYDIHIVDDRNDRVVLECTDQYRSEVVDLACKMYATCKAAGQQVVLGEMK